MKHLRRFNESIDDKNDLYEFCEGYLAYLLDDSSFELDVFNTVDVDVIISMAICLTRYGRRKGRYLKTGQIEFTWSEIKDYYIPFLHILNKEYKIVSTTGSEFDKTDKYIYLPPVVHFFDSVNNVDLEFSLEKVLSGVSLSIDKLPIVEVYVEVIKNI